MKHDDGQWSTNETWKQCDYNINEKMNGQIKKIKFLSLNIKRCYPHITTWPKIYLILWTPHHRWPLIPLLRNYLKLTDLTSINWFDHKKLLKMESIDWGDPYIYSITWIKITWNNIYIVKIYLCIYC